ncbi:MAG: DnaA regulatory inactivator Hda, partial [Coxiellaceae bacterium]|nr:DnaA regulatory inactivator Hda [Coxiellaceae bacterium]
MAEQRVKSLGADQLSLKFQLRCDVTLQNYLAGPNRPIVVALEDFSQRMGWECLFLWGEQGLGKSYLLQATVNKVVSHGLAACYFDLSDPEAMHPTMLEGLEQIDLIALDNIHAIAGCADWEEAIFDCYNRVHAAGKRLLISANNPPNQLLIVLPDLISRLQAAIVFHIKPLNDKEKIALLQHMAQLRGLVLTEEVGTYLVNHY